MVSIVRSRKENFFLALWKLTSGGGAEKQIVHHLGALRSGLGQDRVKVLCNQDTSITGPGIQQTSLLNFLTLRGVFVSYLVHDHVAGFVRKILRCGPWIPFERTHPQYYEDQARLSLQQRLKHTSQIWIYSQFADALLVQTKSAKKAWELKLPAFPTNKIMVLPNLYELPETLPRASNNVFKIIMVGRLDAVKDYPLALKAFSHLKTKSQFSVEIFGTGPERTNLENLSSSFGVPDVVQFRGFVGSKDDIYRSADLLVMTSKFEGSPNAIGEAMSYGLPVVTVDFEAGPRDLFGGIDPRQIETSRDPEKLAALIYKHITSPEWSKSIGLENRDRIKLEFSSKKFVERFEIILNQIESKSR